MMCGRIHLGTPGAVLLFALLALAGSLSAQTGPPYTGYTNAAYSTGTGLGDYIDGVVLRNGSTTLLSNTNTGGAASPYNTFYGSIAAPNLTPGAAYSMDITVCPTYSEYITVFIDLNNDGDFADSGEAVCYTTSAIAAGTTGTINFNAPSGASGLCRMRVRCVWNTTGPHDPIASYSYGEAEDYLVNFGFSITTNSPLPLAAQGVAYNATIQAANGPTPYTWNTSVSGLPNGLSVAQAGGSDDLVLSGTPNVSGTLPQTFNFTLSVTDASNENKSKQFSLTVVSAPASMPYSDDFSSSTTNWVLTGGWQVGSATAYNASSSTSGPTRSEPATDASPTSDNRILGHSIGADYTNNMPAQWATSPPVDCSSATNVQLRFQRWLGISAQDEVHIQVSNNGSTWNDVWSSTVGTINSPQAWTPVAYDITQWAAGNSVVQVRFGIGPTDASIVNVGWCIDDVQILDPGPALQVTEGPTPVTVITDDETVGGLRDFGQVVAGTNSQILELTFTNNGTSTITINTWGKTGNDPDKFIVVQSPASTIAIGASTVMQVQFNSNGGGQGGPGTYTATIEVDHDATGTGVGTTPFQINLKAEAVNPTPHIDVTETNATGNAIPYNDPAANTIRDFGTWDIGAGQSTPITIAISNSGNGPLGIGGVNMGGTNYSDFVVDTGTLTFPVNVPAGQTITFTVAFDPSTTGQKDAVVRVSHNDSSQTSPYLIPVTGVGIATGVPVMSVLEGTTGPNIPYNDPPAGGRDFGSQLVNAGPTTPPLTITVENSGTVDLNITSMPTLGGVDAGQFVLDTTGFTTPIPSGSSSSFTIAFNPTTVGVKTANVTFSHDDPSITSPFIINITGRGVMASATLSVRETNASGNPLTNGAAPSGILDFGGQDIFQGPSAPAVIYIENTGTANMDVAAPAFNPATTEFQLQATGFPATLQPGQSITFSITFDPTTQGTKTAVVEFAHNTGTTSSPFVLNLTGDGTLNAPLIEVREGGNTGSVISSGAPAVAGGGRDFGNIDISAGATQALTIMVLNTGTQPLNLGNPALAGPNASDFVLSIPGGFSNQVAAGAATQFSVAFDPTLGGFKDAQIEFSQDDTSQPTPYVVELTGRALDPNGVRITTSSLPAGTAGGAYGPVQMSAVQGAAPYSWSVYRGSLPTGVNISTSGLVSGTPTGLGGTYTSLIRVTDQNGATNEKQYVVVVTGMYTGKGRAKASGCTTGTEGGGMTLALVALLGLLGLVGRVLRHES